MINFLSICLYVCLSVSHIYIYNSTTRLRINMYRKDIDRHYGWGGWAIQKFILNQKKKTENENETRKTIYDYFIMRWMMMMMRMDMDL